MTLGSKRKEVLENTLQIKHIKMATVVLDEWLEYLEREKTIGESDREVSPVSCI